MDIIENFSWIT